MKYIIVYGSLRKNSKRGYNFNRFGGQTYIRDLILDGYEMYSLGPYPAICKGHGTIHCEVHSVEEQPYQSIRQMEIGAGYALETINISEGKASLFVAPKATLETQLQIVDGDWE